MDDWVIFGVIRIAVAIDRALDAKILLMPANYIQRICTVILSQRNKKPIRNECFLQTNDNLVPKPMALVLGN